MEKTANLIVNKINKEFNLELKTVDSFAMSESIQNVLKASNSNFD